MLEILQSNPWYYALFCIAVTASVIFIVDVNYRYFTKHCLDFVFGLAFILILGIPLLIFTIISKKRAEEGKPAVEKIPYLGAKGKIIYLHRFTGINGNAGKLIQIVDVLSGKMSFVGVKALPVTDGAFIDDEHMPRFNARPGIFNHLVCGGYPEITYEEAFELDAKYAKKREFFKDIWIVLKSLALIIRGECRYLGETENKTYAEALLKRGAISEEHLETAQNVANDAIAEQQTVKEIKKRRYR